MTSTHSITSSYYWKADMEFFLYKYYIPMMNIMITLDPLDSKVSNAREKKISASQWTKEINVPRCTNYLPM